MNTNRVLLALVTLTLMMQGTLLYKQYRGSGSPAGPGAPVRDAPKGSALELAGLPVQGSKDATLVLIEFSDYECPFCARHAASVAGELDKLFIASGKLRHAFVHNPLPIHANARPLATAAICAAEQDHFWEMHNSLFSVKPKTREEILSTARSLPLDSVKFEQCLESSPSLTKEIDGDVEKAKQLGLTGTPGFALGYVDRQGRVTIEKLITGAQPLTVFEKAINELLSKTGAS